MNQKPHHDDIYILYRDNGIFFALSKQLIHVWQIDFQPQYFFIF